MKGVKGPARRATREKTGMARRRNSKFSDAKAGNHLMRLCHTMEASVAAAQENAK